MDRLQSAQESRLPRLPRDHGHLELIEASFGYVREFAPIVLSAVRFAGGTDAAELLAAVNVLRDLYETGARKVPAGTPAGFVPTRWQGYLAEADAAGDATAYRHYWELCGCWNCVTGCVRATCGSPARAATPTRRAT